jgi:DNA-binding CsgD family transcriptional regulator
MVAGPDELLVLAGHLYEAAVTPSLWETALQRICLSFHGLGMALFVLDLRRREVLFRVAYKRPPDELTGGAAVRIPPFGDVDFSALDPGSIPDHQIRRCGETVGHTFQTWVEQGAAPSLGLVVQLCVAPAESPVADADLLAGWRAMAPHLRRAVRIGQQLEQLEDKATVADTVDALLCGLLLLDAAGHVCHMNQPAEAHLARGDGLVVNAEGVVEPRRKSDQRAFSALFAQALNRPGGSESMPLPRSASPYPYVLHVLPLSLKSPRRGRKRPVAALLISEPALRAAVSGTSLKQLFRLTAREAELAARIVQGQSIKGAAEELDISVKTARDHLEAVFRKTGTRRQAELTALAHAFGLCPSLGA